jgi:hypothetical protein
VVWGPYPASLPLLTAELSADDLNGPRFAKLRACIQQRAALGPQVRICHWLLWQRPTMHMMCVMCLCTMNARSPDGMLATCEPCTQIKHMTDPAPLPSLLPSLPSTSSAATQVVPWARAGSPQAAGAGADWQPAEALPAAAAAAAALQAGGAPPPGSRALAAVLAVPRGAGPLQVGLPGVGQVVPYHHFPGRKQQQALGWAQDNWLAQQRRVGGWGGVQGAGGGVQGPVAGGGNPGLQQQQAGAAGQLQMGWATLGGLQQGELSGVVDEDAAAMAAQQGPAGVEGVEDEGSQVLGGWGDPSEKALAWAAAEAPSVSETADSAAGTSAAAGGGAVANAGGGRATGVSKRKEVPGAVPGPLKERVGPAGGGGGLAVSTLGVGYVEGVHLVATPGAGAGGGGTPGKRGGESHAPRGGQAKGPVNKQQIEKAAKQRKGLGLGGSGRK